MSVGLGTCRGPDGQSDYDDENDERRERNEAALRPLHLGLAHVSNKLGALFRGFRGFPIGGRTKGNTEDNRSKDPENREHCGKPVSRCNGYLQLLDLQNPYLNMYIARVGGSFGPASSSQVE